jgi:transcriptional regulator with AAA-type ATPase domain
MQASLLDETAEDDTAEEDAAVWRLNEHEALGLFWVSPAERFDELETGAVIGRSAACSIQLDGSSVSREHAVIERRGPIWAVRDLGSRNGLFVNAKRCERSAVVPQDTVRVGDWVGVVCRMPKTTVRGGDLFVDLTPDSILSVPTWDALSNLDRLARSELPIIIEGETGTGKEVLVRAIHERSRRRGPLIAVNCAALPEALAEGQLFGHRKGAFTGAVDTAQGYVASADGGTLLLDEILELPLAIQSKLLRTLEERTVVPVGSTQAVPVDFRLVVTTQRPLRPLVEAGKFRPDFYARSSGAELKLPPLRERRQEIVRLFSTFMSTTGARAPVLESRFVERLCSYAWPYNVRELRQLARLLAASGRELHDVSDLPERFFRAPVPADAMSNAHDAGGNGGRNGQWLSRRVKELWQLKEALRTSGGNLSEAARKSGIPRHRARRLLAAEARLSVRRGEGA